MPRRGRAKCATTEGAGWPSRRAGAQWRPPGSDVAPEGAAPPGSAPRAGELALVSRSTLARCIGSGGCDPRKACSSSASSPRRSSPSTPTCSSPPAASARGASKAAWPASARSSVLAVVVGWIHRYLHRTPSGSRARGVAEFFRMALPFVMCIAVYTNLHDTVRFVNPHDIHQHLAAAEQWLFGGQPVVWAERYITRERTEFFNLFYANFYRRGAVGRHPAVAAPALRRGAAGAARHHHLLLLGLRALRRLSGGAAAALLRVARVCSRSRCAAGRSPTSSRRSSR